MKKKICLIFFTLTLIFIQLSFNSCVSKKKINYFQDSEVNDTVKKVNNYTYTPVFKADDYLGIDISASDQESIKPFMLDPAVQTNQGPSYNNGVAARLGYLIDIEGNIDFPLLGKLHLGGLNRIEATTLIKSKLSEYISNPVVNIRIQNFKVTVLGDVKNPGSFNIPNERITLPEILGVAGDLNISGVRNNILVIRDIDGIKTEYRVDLTTKEVFSSPVYYLSQNDVIFVEPNRAKRNSSLISATAGIFISVTSLILTTVNLLTK